MVAAVQERRTTCSVFLCEDTVLAEVSKATLLPKPFYVSALKPKFSLGRHGRRFLWMSLAAGIDKACSQPHLMISTATLCCEHRSSITLASVVPFSTLPSPGDWCLSCWLPAETEDRGGSAPMELCDWEPPCLAPSKVTVLHHKGSLQRDVKGQNRSQEWSCATAAALQHQSKGRQP